jgi:hypothetical protein
MVASCSAMGETAAPYVGTLRAPGDKPRFIAAGWAGEKDAQVDATRKHTESCAGFRPQAVPTS